MRFLVSLGALLFAAVCGAVACLAFMFLTLRLLLLFHVPDTQRVVGFVAGLLSLGVGVLTARSLWRRLRPRNPVAEYWKQVRDAALRGEPAPRSPAGPSVQLNAEGFVWLGQGQPITVQWGELHRVTIRTQRANVMADDALVLFSLHDGRQISMPLESVHGDLLKQVQQLPGFDHEALISAVGSTEQGETICWDAHGQPTARKGQS
jgi:hypothetical protein